MGEARDIFIAGAGIGGLTAALTLAALGFRVVVCERAEKLSEIGAGIQLSPNAGRVLDSLGLDNAFDTAACEPTALDVRSGPSGSLISSIPLTGTRQRFGFPWRVIARAELQAVLTAAVTTNPLIDLRLGTALVDFVDGADELLLGTETRSGRSVQPAAALVAADGVLSTFREKIPGASRPKSIGRTAWRATLPARAVEHLVPAMRIGLWLGADAHLIHYPIAGGRTVNFVAIVAEDWKGVGWSEPGDQYWLADRFASWAPTARRLIAAPAEWRKWAILSVDPGGSWTNGRVALLGDAAHAMPPFMAQGAAMAIEDAAVLAACFAQSPNDAAVALGRYVAARKPRVARISEAAIKTGKYYHFDQPMAALRDTVLRLAGRQLTLRKNSWVYGWKLES